MKKRIAIVSIVYFLLALTILAPYISSFIFIKAMSSKVSESLIFDLKSYSVFFDFLKSNQASDPYFKIPKILGFLGFLIPFLLPIFIGIIAIIANIKKLSIHGEARLANDNDLSKSGFFPDKETAPAILIGKMFKGKYKNKFVKYCGQQFLMLFAPTRSGKGVGIVIPNCLYYKESIVVLDIKLENFIFSAGHRKDKMKQDVFLFCPEGWKENPNKKIYKTHRYNPLFYIDRDLNERATDLSKIAGIIFPKTGGENDMWTDLSDNLFQAIVLFLLDCENEKDSEGNLKYKVTLSEVSRISSPENGLSLGEFFLDQIEKRNSEDNILAWQEYAKNKENRPKLNMLNEKTVAKMSDFANLPEKQQGNIMLQFYAEMKIFNNPITAQATDGNDFDFREIRRKKMSIYFGLSPDGIGIYKKLTNLFFSQLIGQNVKSGMLPSQDPTLKHQCLLILDEFTSMGKVEVIQDSVAFTAGYNMRYLFILQDKSQLEDQKNYGKEGAETLRANCAVELVYPPKEVNEHIKGVSESIGYYDYETKTKNKSKGKGSNSTSYNATVNKRAVLLPQEIVDMRDIKHKSGISTREIIMSEFSKAFVADKIIYFDEPYFLDKKNYSEKNIPSVPTLNLQNDEVFNSMMNK